MRFRAGFAEATAVGLLAASAVAVGLSVGSSAYAADYALDTRSVSRGQTTAVLIRFEAIFNGKLRKVDGTLYQPMPYLANMDRGEAPVRVPLSTSYRVKGAEDGWIAWGLQPGTYFLLVRPTGWPGSPPSSFYDPVQNTYRLVTRHGDAAGCRAKIFDRPATIINSTGLSGVIDPGIGAIGQGGQVGFFFAGDYLRLIFF